MRRSTQPDEEMRHMMAEEEEVERHGLWQALDRDQRIKVIALLAAHRMKRAEAEAEFYRKVLEIGAVAKARS